jgi:hypothetical protein
MLVFSLATSATIFPGGVVFLLLGALCGLFARLVMGAPDTITKGNT